MYITIHNFNIYIKESELHLNYDEAKLYLETEFSKNYYYYCYFLYLFTFYITSYKDSNINPHILYLTPLPLVVGFNGKLFFLKL